VEYQGILNYDHESVRFLPSHGSRVFQPLEKLSMVDLSLSLFNSTVLVLFLNLHLILLHLFLAPLMESSGEVIVMDEGICGSVVNSIRAVLESNDPRDDEGNQHSAHGEEVKESANQAPHRMVRPEIVKIGDEGSALEVIIEEAGKRRENCWLYREENSF
jgi:hypothetical protein